MAHLDQAHFALGEWAAYLAVAVGGRAELQTESTREAVLPCCLLQYVSYSVNVCGLASLPFMPEVKMCCTWSVRSPEVLEGIV